MFADSCPFNMDMPSHPADTVAYRHDTIRFKDPQGDQFPRIET